MEEHYTRQEVIGRGNFGVVYKGQHIPSGKVVAIKVLNLDTINDDVEDVQREIALLALLSKKESNIIKYYESFLTGTKLWIIMDLCAGGSMRTLLKAGPLGDKHLSVVYREMLIAISHMHREGIIHRDIKAANILITLEGNVRVCDFGVAADTDVNRTKRTTLVGTPYWMAPEVVIEGQEYNTKADIWSAGITLFEMATGNPPYSEQEAVRALLMISKGRPPRLEGPNYSALLKDIVALCLDEDPTVRPTADDLLKHKFIKQYQKLGTFVLRELIERFRLWQQRSNNRRDSLVGVEEDIDNVSISSEAPWDFDNVEEADGEVLEYMGEAPKSLGELFEGQGAPEPQAPPAGHNPVPTLVPPAQLQTPNSPGASGMADRAAPGGDGAPAPGTAQQESDVGQEPTPQPPAMAAARKLAPLQTSQLGPLHSSGSTPTSATFAVPAQPPIATPTLGAAYNSRSTTSLPPSDLNHPLRLNRAKSQRAALSGATGASTASQSSTAINMLQASPGRDAQRSRAHSYGQAPISPGRVRVAAPSTQPPPAQGQLKLPSRLGTRMMSAPKLPGLGKTGNSHALAHSGLRSKFPAAPTLDAAILSDAASKQAVVSQLSQVLESFAAGLKCLDAKLSDSNLHA